MISTLASGAAADRLIQGGKIPKVWIRRGFVITGYSGMVICGLVLANLTGCNPVAAVALLCITQGFNGMTVKRSAIQGVGGIFTAVFMRTDVQPWARG
ncbi:Hypp3709 [Branchiostoma lanceolatum]|uniref:Hypp3709 protein n=1 Tax=Branchiostoma lanceolatum TaxID=7740 RepID=A0A8K0A0V9_BRALA|nr:Hypp3709 [Branchiostoma lanceolatum]